MSHHPTPDLGHLRASDYNNVYEPAEDTFLFLDALQKDVEFIRALRPSICLEIGSGSGCVTTFLGTLLGEQSKALYLTTDINPHAISATVATGLRNGVTIDALQSDLIPPFTRPRSIDVLLFNPPYVVTPPEEVWRGYEPQRPNTKPPSTFLGSEFGNGSNGIEASWAGGIDGREVIDRLLPQIQDALSARGVFFMVVINENKPEEIRSWMGSEEMGMFSSEVVLSRKAGREGLSILKFWRT
ncbi:S-adenosyl-L-methionine-dependent methyltransferase [Fimicolochytrium jonesii]|uniref:S-adenosyl-L-methionine-dependent methyltransferase n=1 Tax=Fimicolochytrium jonesii TaxID=1396493 RepID=UPI0022FED429|nr:S-adenosyl-L-methionine-dependent methyltransferase [Fimicolochytrium jonesii]KAI8826657.1 S-adenosyl-L-methionine-dependent methyltransferase [Fimicolochytrium jonesii]